MIQLSSPTRVTPPSCAVPRLKVQNSRIVLRSPICSSVGSPAYFLSCGAPPSEQNWKMRLSRADRRAAVDHAVRADRRAGADAHAAAPITRVGADLDAVAELGAGSTIAVGWIAAPWCAPPGSAARCASCTSARPRRPRSPPTSARALNLKMPAFVRVEHRPRACSWSPGSTGRLKRASSMPTK